MPRPISTIEIVDFNGLVTSRGKLNAPPGAASVFKNMRATKPGEMSVRKGMDRSTDGAPSADILAMKRLDRPEGAGIVYQAEGSIYFRTVSI